MPEHTIAENLARLQAAKTAIGNAIVAKGGTVNSGDGLEEYPADIASIETANLTSISITENGVYSSGDTEEVESSTLPIVVEADGTPLLDYLISGNMVQSGTPTPTTPIQPQECGELETSGVKAGQYKIPISSANTTTPIYLGEVQTTRKIKKLVLTGEENWGGYNLSLSGIGAMLTVSNMLSNSRIRGFCTHFSPQYSPSQSSINGITYGAGNNSLYITFSVATATALGITDTAGIKSWLAKQYANNTPVTIWYVLKEPTTGIVNEPLRKIGDYADTLSMEQAGVDIQTNTSPSTTTIDIPITLSPSLLYVKYNTLSTTSGYNHVDVNVPNTYTQSDEGKVVSNGELVAQTTKPDVIVKNGAYDTTLYNSVNVNVSSEPQERKDVNFYDYDGTIVKSYTAAEFVNISELPTNPSHAGLTAQGWNWSLADAKAYVAKYGKLNIGQMYITDDGKTRIYITLTEGRISPILQLYLYANSELDIDWGDGSTHSTFTSTSAGYVNERHNYATAGDYVIAITVITGSFVLQSSSTPASSILWNGNNSASSPDRAYNNSIQKIEIGTGITSIKGSAFSGCYSLSSITIPDGVTSISDHAFYYCYSLSSITIPDGITSIGNYAFYNCYSLSSITIPDSVTSIDSYAFQYCYSLASITIPDSVTSIERGAFYECYSLPSITIPNTVTSIGTSAFQYCYSLSSITIPDSVTSISSSAFYYCFSLSSVTIGNSVTTIDTFAFSECKYMESIKFTSTTPPSVSNSNAWTNVPTTCIIYVPRGTLNAYKTATNYPNPSKFTYVEY